MTRSRLSRAGLAIAALTAALALPLGALAGSQVPLEGADAGGFGPGDHSCAPGYDSLDIDGTGNATHVGTYAYHADECFSGATLLFDGSFTITAANGDTVVGTYSGVVPSIDFPVAVYEQGAEITGGTGRFAGASGEFHVSGLANLATGAYSQALSGVVSSPGAAKK
ncbi:MAG TPA: hypothetical protein VFR38_06810 [Gaiellaceae bacterium]|nr:hypothetical protein [Gaiellaceae bacterium]